jgi:oligopeptide/dipeptide ABC transporter ATP-binding protein
MGPDLSAADSDRTKPLVSIRNLNLTFNDRGSSDGQVHAVRGVTFSIWAGETYAVVGESGSGKSTLARCALRLIRPTAGEVWFQNVRLDVAEGTSLRRVRRQMGVVFQSPFASLDPHMRAHDAIAEPLVTHLRLNRESLHARLEELIRQVGLNMAHLDRYPHELSGGQQQRVAIARALALSPRLLVLDEPTSALDVSVQAQVLNLLSDLRSELGLAYLFISHDLAVVEHLADRIAVMYLGKFVEEAPTEGLFSHPGHPYTRALLDAAPRLNRATSRDRVVLGGDVPSPRTIPGGCSFHSRCWLYERLGRPAACTNEEPPLQEVSASHRTACHFPDRMNEADRPAAL